MATQAEVAQHLGIKQPAVAKLVSAGVFTQSGRGSLDVDRCRNAYLARLREEAAGRASQAEDDDGLDLVAERARLAAAQADRIELELAETVRSLVRVEHVAAIFGKHVAEMRTRLLALPSECAPLVAHLRDPAQIDAILSDRLHDAMRSLCDIECAIPEAPPEADATAEAPPASERALFTQRRKEAYEALHPETKHGTPGVSRQVGDTHERSSESRFTADTASRTGQSQPSNKESSHD